MKICVLSSVHTYNDVRIFYRECKTFLKAGFEVDLIAVGNREVTIDGIRFIPFKTYESRLLRLIMAPWKMFEMARSRKADVFHLHDPELIITGLLLRVLGKKVVFDVHENIVEQIRTKDWVPFRNLVADLFRIFDFIAAKSFYLILAENSYEEIYQKYTKRYKIVLNMPDLSFFDEFNTPDRTQSENGIFYIGRVSEERGIREVLEALKILKQRSIDFTFNCVGPMSTDLVEDIRSDPRYKEIIDQLHYYGYKDLKEGYLLSRGCKAGISILKPIGNYLTSYSTKVFEYMAVSMPFVTSDFELYKAFVNKYECGFCVDPNDPTRIADALETLLVDEERAAQMGSNGRTAAEEYFNWDREGQKLIDFYKDEVAKDILN